MKTAAALILAAVLAARGQVSVTGPNSFFNLPGDAPAPVLPPEPPAPKPTPAPTPAPAAKPALPALAKKLIKTPEDILRDMPIGTGIYSAGKPSPAGIARANASFSRITTGRPIDVTIGVAQSEYSEALGQFVIQSHAAPYRHRLDDILVGVEVIIPEIRRKELRSKYPRGTVTSLSGTIESVRFQADGPKVLLVVTVKDPVFK